MCLWDGGAAIGIPSSLSHAWGKGRFGSHACPALAVFFESSTTCVNASVIKYVCGSFTSPPGIYSSQSTELLYSYLYVWNVSLKETHSLVNKTDVCMYIHVYTLNKSIRLYFILHSMSTCLHKVLCFCICFTKKLFHPSTFWTRFVCKALHTPQLYMYMYMYVQQVTTYTYNLHVEH